MRHVDECVVSTESIHLKSHTKKIMHSRDQDCYGVLYDRALKEFITPAPQPNKVGS